MTRTSAQIRALRSIAAGDVGYSLSYGAFVGARSDVMDRLEDLVVVKYDDEPVGRITRAVPVELNAAGVLELETLDSRIATDGR